MESRIILSGVQQYAHLDRELLDEFDFYFQPLCNFPNVGIQWWRDTQGHVGVEWDPALKERFATGHVVLQALTPNFFAKADPSVSGYIWTDEMRVIEARGAEVVRFPVGLARFPTTDDFPRGLQRFGYVVLAGPRGTDLFFEELDRPSDKRRFAHRAADLLRERLKAQGLIHG
jgi:hypothetical protein